MGTLNDSGDSFPDVLQFEQTDPVVTGEPNEATGAGLDNIPHLQLARRTRWLKTRVDTLLQAVVSATTNVPGIVRLNDTLTSNSVDQAATANAVRLANSNANNRVPLTRTITGAGLATGGGALDINRIITVPKATPAQAVQGLADDVAMTPATVRALFEAMLASGGGAYALVPTGAIMDFGMPEPPPGWLVCDGSEEDRVEQAALFAAIGTRWGAGNGTTTFNRPDARAAFRRGWDNGRGIDPGGEFASTQTPFAGTVPRDGWGTTGSGGLGMAQAGRLLVGSGLNEQVETLESIRAAGNDLAVTPGDTRPFGIVVLTCIKA
jgi:hypothetical protein